jgi:RNA polymerase sigma factor (sigma-70 family)
LFKPREFFQGLNDSKYLALFYRVCAINHYRASEFFWDIFQDCVLEMIERYDFKEFMSVRGITKYLAIMLRSRVINYIRDRGIANRFERMVEEIDEVDEVDGFYRRDVRDVEVGGWDREIARKELFLTFEVAGLNEKEQLVVMKLVDGYRVCDIAKEMEVNERTVRRWIEGIVLKVRRALDY